MNNGWITVLVAICLCCCSNVPNVEIGPNINVASLITSPKPYTEPFIAVNPIDPKNLIIGTIRINPEWECVAFVSHDGGLDWTEVHLPIPDTLSFTADPYIDFDAEGNAYYVLLGDGPNNTLDMAIFKSGDGGDSWTFEGPISAGPKKFLDHSTITIDRNKDSPNYGSIYAVAHTYFRNLDGHEVLAPFLARAADDNLNFSEKTIYEPSKMNLNNGNMVIASKGDLFLFYFVFMNEDRQWLDEHLLYVIQSSDGGKTFGRPVKVTNNFTAYLPDAGVDRSERFKDRIYVTYSKTGDTNPGVFVSYSDGSVTDWSPQVRVSDSLAHTPLMSDVAVSSDGIVGVSWFDHREAEDGCYDIYFSYSLDGGLTFSENLRVTTVSSCPTESLSGGAFRRWKRGGDYHTLTAGFDGNFYIVWPDARDGLFQPFFTKITVQ